MHHLAMYCLPGLRRSKFHLGLEFDEFCTSCVSWVSWYSSRVKISPFRFECVQMSVTEVVVESVTEQCSGLSGVSGMETFKQV